MGARINVYLGDEILIDKFGKEENKSELVATLLLEHYNEDLEYLNQQKRELTSQIDSVNMRIDRVKKLREEKAKASKKTKAEELKIIEQDVLLARIQKDWKAEKMTDDEYFNFFDKGQLNMRKARKYANS